MIHARSDYDAIQPWPTKRPHIAKTADGRTETMPSTWGKNDPDGILPLIPDDEPVFLVRGQDPAALATLWAWIDAAREHGADEGIIAAVERHMDLIRAWQENRSLKAPDAPDGSLR